MISAPRPILRDYLALLERVPDVFRRSWDAIAIYDLEGRLVAGNAAARNLLGDSFAASLRGQHFNAHLTLDVARRSARAFAECVTSGKPVEGYSTFRGADGAAIPVRARLVPARLDGVVVGVIGFARDVRPLRNAQSQFMRAEQQFRSLFENHPDAVAMHDLEGHYVRVNAAMTKLTGYTPDEVIGQTPQMLVAGRWQDGDRIRACVRRGETAEFERVLRTKSGERIDTVGLAVPLLVDGEVRGYCGIVRDVTAELRARRESARAAKRIGDLYAVAAASSVSADDKVASALDLARVELDANLAYVGRFEGGRLELSHVSGTPSEGHQVGSTIEIEPACARCLAEADDAFVVHGSEAWRSFVGVPLFVNGERYGVAAFVSAANTLHFSAMDRDYARAIGALVASAVQQSLHEQRLGILAFHDELTGLPNRALLSDRLERALLTARRNRRSFAVHYVDIDHFKLINDTYGHHAGDGVLVAIADWLRAALRDSDTVARIGGDEFVILQPEIESAQQAEDVAARLVAIREAPLDVGGSAIAVRLSVGVAVYSGGGHDPGDMLRLADAALYEVKKSGRDGYSINL